MDGFSKWAEAFSVKHHDAETIAGLLVEQVFCRYETPLSLLTDQGRDVDGQLMRQFVNSSELKNPELAPISRRRTKWKECTEL